MKMRPTMFLLVAGWLFAQAPPPKVIQKTPMPAASALPATNPGAYRDPGDGEVVLPDGRVLAQATPGPAPQPARAPQDAAPYTTDTSQAPSQYRTADDVRGEEEADQAYIAQEKGKLREADAQQEQMAAAIAQLQQGVQSGGAGKQAVDPRGDLARYTKETATAPELAAQKGFAIIEASRIIQFRSITAANTQLGGTIVGMIERDVHDLQGKWILIPAGSKILGHVRTITDQGQTRATIVFSQVIRPDGEQIPLFVDAPAADGQGRAGVAGKVNRRWGLKTATAVVYGVLMGAVAPRNAATAGGFSTLGGGGFGGAGSPPPSANDIVKSNISQLMGQIGQQQVQQTFAIPPEIDVPMNTRMSLILPSTVYVRPWKRRLP